MIGATTGRIVESRWGGPNPWPATLRGFPTRIVGVYKFWSVPPVGFEPTTNGLKVHCANQAAPQGRDWSSTR